MVAALIREYGLQATDLDNCVLWSSDDSRLAVLSQPSVTAPDAVNTWATAVEVARTPNVANGPDGSLIADRIADTAANNQHYTGTPVAAHVTGVPATCRMFVKYESRRWVLLQLGGSYASFDVQNGVVGTVSVGLTDRRIIPVGDGWYRCEIDTTGGATTDMFLQLRAGDNAGTNYVGDGSSVLACGASVTQNRLAQRTDRSGAGNHFVQAADAAMAQWRAADGPLGRPTIVSDGVDDHMSNAVENTTAEYTIFAVVRFVDPTGQCAIWSNRHLVAPGGGTLVFLGTQVTTGKIFCFMNTASIPSLLSSSALVANEWGIAELAVDASGRAVALDGIEVTDAANTTITKIPSGYLWRDSGLYSAGQFGDMAMWTRRLSSDSRARIRQALARRYGLRIGGEHVAYSAELWLDENFGVTVTSGEVSAWANRGTAGAALNFVGATPGARPSWTNSRIDFDGANDRLTSTGRLSDFATASAVEVYAVVEVDTYSSHAASYANDTVIGDSGAFLTMTIKDNAGSKELLGVNYDGSVDVAASTSVTPTVPHLLMMRHAGGFISSRVDAGTEIFTASGNTSNLAFGDLRVGVSYDLTTNFLDGRIRQIFGFKRNLGTQERAAFRAWLGEQYGQAW